jgi:hypothetical protein
VVYYVPGTEEKDTKKVIMSLQQAHENIATNTTDIATNTADIATNTADIATNTASIAAHEAAWTTWTPTVVPASGAFTTVAAAGAYIAIGKTVHYTVTITITTANTAAGDMSLALPVGTANRDATAVSIETAAIGTMGFAFIPSGGSSITRIRRSDNTTWIASGRVVILTGTYERA